MISRFSSFSSSFQVLLIYGLSSASLADFITSGVSNFSLKFHIISLAFAIFFSISARFFSKSHFQSFFIAHLNSGELVTALKKASNHVSF